MIGDFDSIKRSPFFRYGIGGGMALAVAWFAVSALPPEQTVLAWTVIAAALGTILRQGWLDWRDAVDAAAEDAALEDRDVHL